MQAVILHAVISPNKWLQDVKGALQDKKMNDNEILKS